MNGVAHVWPEPPRRTGDLIEAAAVVEWPWRVRRFWKGRRQRVWIRVPGALEVSETAVADAFLLGTLFGAMRRARAIHLHATATEDLVGNLLRLAALWETRRPDAYGAIDIRCERLETGAGRAAPALLCFSGGLDSAYSLFRHTDRDRPAPGPPLGAALMIHGADIPVEEEAAFAQAFARSRVMAESRGVPLFAARTNLRRIRQGWTSSHNAALAAVMNLFRGRYGSGLIAVGYTRREAPLWWPQDETDPPLVSSRALPISGDGYEADRFEKFDAIREWPEALEHLRVCYRPGSWTGNCGECMKCWTVGLFARLATGGTPRFLPRPTCDADARSIAASGDPRARVRLEQVLKHARARGVREPWIEAVENALREVPGA